MIAVNVRTTSGASYRVVNDDLPGCAAHVKEVEDAIEQGELITVAVDFQGGGQAYTEDVRFYREHVETISVRRSK